MLNRIFKQLGGDGASLTVPKRRRWWQGLDLCRVVKERKNCGDCLAMRITVLSRSKARKRPTDLKWEEEFLVGPIVIRVLVAVLSSQQYESWEAIDALMDSIDEKMAAD